MLDQEVRFQASLHPVHTRGTQWGIMILHSRDLQSAASAGLSVVLLTGPQIPQLYNADPISFYFRSLLMLEALT